MAGVIIKDDKELVLGWAEGAMPYQVLLPDQLTIVKRFLLALRGEQKTELKVETKNKVILAGKIKKIAIKKDSVWFLLEGENGNKDVPVSSHVKETRARQGLLADLSKFAEGDSIHLLAFIRPWSKKDEDGNWYNGIDIRCVDVKPDCIPKREARQEQQEEEAW